VNRTLTWQDKCGRVNAISVVFDCEIGRYFAGRCGDLHFLVNGSNHEADLTRGIGGDGGVTILDLGEDSLDFLEDLVNEVEMEPLALALSTGNTALGVKSILDGQEELRLEEHIGRSYGVGGITDDHIVVLAGTLFAQISSSVVDNQLQTRVVEGRRQRVLEELLADSNHLINSQSKTISMISYRTASTIHQHTRRLCEREREREVEKRPQTNILIALQTALPINQTSTGTTQRQTTPFHTT
jgi:hypothetical protein